MNCTRVPGLYSWWKLISLIGQLGLTCLLDNIVCFITIGSVSLSGLLGGGVCKAFLSLSAVFVLHFSPTFCAQWFYQTSGVSKGNSYMFSSILGLL